MGKGCEVNTPANANAAHSGGTRTVEAHTETLPQVAAQWRALLPSVPAPPYISGYPDPASAAVAAAMVDWPAIQAARNADRKAAADAFVAAVDKTAVAFAATDRGAAAAVSGSAGPMPL